MIYERLRKIIKEKGLTITGTEAALGFAKGSLCKIDTSKPSQERIDKLSKYLGVSTEYIMTGKEGGESYYIDDGVREIAKFLYESPEYRVAFDAIRGVRKEDVGFVTEMIKRMSK